MTPKQIAEIKRAIRDDRAAYPYEGAQFRANCRNWMPQLVAEIERCWKRIAELENVENDNAS